MSSESYCWSCHGRHSLIQEKLVCSTCPRSFHDSPACSHATNMSLSEAAHWRCQCCRDLAKDEELLRSKGTPTNYVNELLTFVTAHLLKDEFLCIQFKNIDYSKVKGKVFNPLDLTSLAEKAAKGVYSCYEAFWADVKWIEHNTKIHHTSDAKATNWLLKFVQNEINSIRLCPECFRNANYNHDNWFTMLCSPPHILVWAKHTTYPYWPAKLMQKSSNGKVDVQFFGHKHEWAQLPAKRCFILSKESVDNDFNPSAPQRKGLMQEIKKYIQNVINEYGSFNYADPHTPLNIDYLDSHLYDMIPGYVGIDIIPNAIPKPSKLNLRRSRSFGRALSLEQDDVEVVANGNRSTPTVVSTNAKVTKKDTNKMVPLKRQKLDKSLNKSAQSRKKINIGALGTPANKVNRGSKPVVVKPSSSVGVRKAYPEKLPFIRLVDVLTEPGQMLQNEITSSSDGAKTPLDSGSKHSPELRAICNKLVEKNTQELTDTIRSRLQVTLFGFLDAAKPTEHIQDLQQKLVDQQEQFGAILDTLHSQMSTILTDLKNNYRMVSSDNDRVLKANNELIKIATDMEAKNVQLADDLKKAEATNLGVANCFSLLKTLEAERDSLLRTNSQLKAANALSESELENVHRQKDILFTELKEKESLCIQMVNETKQRQWCFNCKKPGGGRYYCSEECDEHYRKANPY